MVLLGGGAGVQQKARTDRAATKRELAKLREGEQAAVRAREPSIITPKKKRTTKDYRQLYYWTALRL